MLARELPEASVASSTSSGFSLQYELTYSNVLLQVLETGGIPLWAKDRGEDDPLVVCGGPTATHAEPMAPFVDAFLIGDGEQKVPEMLLTWAALRKAGMPRAERLVELAKLGGWYVPSLYRTGARPGDGLPKSWRRRHPEAPYPVDRAILREPRRAPLPDGTDPPRPRRPSSTESRSRSPGAAPRAAASARRA